MTVETCLLKHLGAKSPINAYRADMAADVQELVADGMTSEAAWIQVVDAKLTDLKAERGRIEQVVADAYAKTAAGKPAEAKPVASTAPKPAASANTIFTEDAAAAARARLKAKLGRLTSGLDPETLMDGITLAGYHVEKGARTFAAYARAMVDDMGDAVKPYLQQWYMALRADPKAGPLRDDMDKASAVEDLDIDAVLRADVAEPSTQADTQAKEAQDDPTPSTSAAPVNQDLAGRPLDEPVSRGSRQPRRKPRRADDRSVRESGGLFEGLDDEGGDVGDGQGAGAVPDGAPDDVERSGGRVSASDFQPAVGGLTREGSWFDSAKRNLDLIDLARQIEADGRDATPDEQAQLAKYVGFGASEIRNNIFPVAQPWHKHGAPAGALIFPEAARDARWKSLAERAAALPIEWQRTILQSTQYAHYTSEGIIRSVWSAVQRLGFTGGKVFEPGGGIGSFSMLMPATVRKTSKFTGIEFDGPTALIARMLSPQQNMLHDDFIKRRLPDNFFDVSVGNPPFSQTKITADPRYQKHGFMLHDYFFAKAIDKVRPGGLLAFVTSKGTMDKQSDKARRYLMERADLIGAIRLPSTAFEDNAGTSVVTDVIFLRKRMPGEAPGGQPWAKVATVDTKDGPVVINEYFAANPDMVLGQNRISGNTDDQGRRINSNGMGGEKYTVVSYDSTPAELDAKFAAAVERLPANVYSAMAQEPVALKAEVAKVDFDPKIKREGVVYVGKDGTVLRVEDGVGKPLADAVKLSTKDAAWMADYVGVRDLVKEAQLAQVTGGAWEGALKKLNKAYDAFVKKNGPINAFRTQTRKSTDEDGNEVESTTRIFTNRRLFREDYDSALMTQLETIDEDGNVKKAAFLKDRTIGKPVTREIKSIGDALAVSLDAIGRLNIDDVAARLKITRDDAIDALGTQVYREPGGDWLLADEYLSGNVVEKLAQAVDAARLDKSLTRNVEALKAVQPEKLGPSQISVKLGAPWVDVKHVNEFADEIDAGRVTFDPLTETWQVDGGNMRSQRKAGAEYGTAARSPSELLESVLNSRSIKVMMTVDKKQVVDSDATTAANEMAKKIKDKFKSWVWTDSERAADLVEAYNARYNNLAPRVFDGSHLTLPGVSLRYKLHPHQLRAIWRQIQTGSTYLAHAVGAGKTIEMIAGGMEQKRLGLIRKPMYVVPNHMLEQFSNEFMELYPLANIMVADDQNFSKDRRKAFVAAATLNAPDAIVITHDAFQRIGVKAESVDPIRDEILADLEEEMADAAKDSGARVRRGQLQQQIEAVTQRFDSILAAGKKDGVVDFEDMGVDFIYADEAHVYRKLDFHTAQSIKGIDPNGSRRALDMYVKTRWLDKQRPGRAMVFASGTAVTNTMGEIYTIMRFFDPKMLDEGGISTFDSWARMFGEVAAALEPNAAGKYEVVERFAKFDNVPELMARVRKFMDVLQSDQLGAIVKRPDTVGGKPNLNLVEPTQAMKDYQSDVLQPRLEASRKWKPSKDEPNNPDPVIAIISDGRLAATDPRFTPGGRVLPGETTKIDTAAAKIAAEYAATAGNVYVDRDGKPMAAKGGTQIVFYNVGFGAASSARRGFDSRGTFTKAIVAGGVKRDHIAWFDDADTDAKKESIFKGMRNGTYRVLIGSAKKMGTGVNVQNRLTALHYMDPPWFPADVEQPRGRIIRQGNQNAIVREEWYATKGGYDSTMWQMVGRKQRFIDQAFRGDKNLRSMEDLGEASMYEQAAALASGDPRAMLLAGLRQDVERLERQQAAHASEQVNARTALKSAEWEIASAEKRMKTYGDAYKAIGSSYFQFSAGEIGGVAYTKQTEFGQALKEAFNKGAAAAMLSPTLDARKLGTIGDGLVLEMHPEFTYVKDGDTSDAKMTKVPSGRHGLTVTAGSLTLDVGDQAAAMGSDVDALGLARKVVNSLNGIESDMRRARAKIDSNQIDINRLRKKIGAPFEHQQEMLEKWADLKALEEELRLEGLAAEGLPEPLDAEQDAGGDAPLFSLAERVNAMRERGQAFGLANTALPADTAAYGTVSQADRFSVKKLESALGAARSGLVLDPRPAVDGAPAGQPLRGLDRTRVAAAELAQRLFDKQVTYFTSSEPFANGLVSSKQPNRVFVLHGASRPHMAILGHELLHSLRIDRPDLYAKLADRIMAVTNDRSDADMGLQLRRLKAGLPTLDDNLLEEEFVADVVGDRFTEPEFWQLMAKDQPAGFKAVIQAVLKFLDDTLSKIADIRPFGTEVYLKDIRAAREAVAEALRNYSAGEVGSMAGQDEAISLSVAGGQTETAAFKRWFGESKVVDANGEPLVVYHGSPAGEPITEFKAADGGIYFTSRRDMADGYTSQRGIWLSAKTGLVTDAYVSMQNPMVIDALGKRNDNIPVPWQEWKPKVFGALPPGAVSVRAAAERAKANGHDGLIVRNVVDTVNTTGTTKADVFVAFRPEQIKSAIGNRGTFDGTDPDIRLSIAGSVAERVDQIRGMDQTKMRNALADLLGSAGAKVSWWDKYLGTQYAKAEKFPAYKRVFDRVQSYIEDVSTLANEAADQAPEILPKLENLKDLKQSLKSYGLKGRDAVAVAAPVFQGTLNDQKVYGDEELRDRFGLNDKQIGQYRQFLAAVNVSLDQVVAADVLKLLGDKNPGLRDLALADRDAMRSGIDDYLTEQAELSGEDPAATDDARGPMTKLRDDIREKYERIDKLKSEGYAPLMRFGKYKVFIADTETGDSLFFGLYETRAAANRMARDLAEDPQFKDARIEQGVLSEDQYKLFNSVPVESLEMFAEAVGAEKSEVFQAYLRLAKNNRSALKRLIHRKGTAGFSEDVGRVLAAFVTSNSRLASGAINLTAANGAVQDIRDGDIKDEAIRLVESVQNPKETAAGVRALMFTNFIGGSIASAMVNLTQPVTMTLPYLSQFGGLAKATGRLMAAGKMVAGGKIRDPELAAAMKRAEDDGIVSPQEIHHLQAQAMGTWGTSALAKQAAFIWGAPFSLAEQFNRRVSFVAAYQTAKEQGIGDPFAFAEKAVVETQGLYNKGNMPNLSRNAIGAAAMQFKQFSIHYLEWMKRMWNAGEPGSAERRAGRKAVLIALALLMVAAGADGLPFADDMDDLIDTLGQALGYDTNSKKARRDFVAKTLGLGDMTADVFARGLSAMPGVPLDVSLRMSMGDLIPGSGLMLRSNTDRSRDLLEIAGPAGGMARQYMDASEKALSGDFTGAAAGFLPMAAQNALKAMDMWSTGEARDMRGHKVMDADQVDGLMKFFGFNPQSIARESQKMGMIRRSEQLAKNVEGEIASRWARAFADGDAEGVRDARQDVADWNRNNPGARIQITSAQIIQRVRKLRQSRAQRFITSVSPERRRDVTETMQ